MDRRHPYPFGTRLVHGQAQELSPGRRRRAACIRAMIAARPARPRPAIRCYAPDWTRAGAAASISYGALFSRARSSLYLEGHFIRM